MLDGRYLRDNLDAVRAALGARAAGWDFDRFVALDDERRRLIGEVEGRQALRNEASKTIGELMRTGQRDEAEAAKERVRVINEEIAGLDGTLAQVEADLREMLLTIPNIPHESVPVGRSAEDNAVELYVIGKKGVSYFTLHKRPIAQRYDQPGDMPTFADAEKAAASTWIYTIARNCRTDFFRRLQKFDTPLSADDVCEVQESEEAFTVLHQKRTRDRIRGLMRELPADQSLILAMEGEARWMINSACS